MTTVTPSANPAKSPPITLPLSFILSGVTSLVLLQILLFLKAPMIFGPFRFNSATLTAVHLFTLGWATAIIMGAFYQLIPVILLTDAAPTGGALFQGITYLVGAALLITGFWLYYTPLIITGGSLVVIAVTLFVILIGRSMRTTKLWTVTGNFLISSMGFLFGTVVWGLTLAFNLRYNFLGNTLSSSPLTAHLVLGIGGWFTTTIIGVAYHLIPMFTLSHRTSDRIPKLVLGLITAGLWFAFVTLTFGLSGPVPSIGLLTALAGVTLFVKDLLAILKVRKRPRIDLGIRYALTSFGFLVLAIILGLLGFSGLVPALEQTPGPSGIIYFGFLGFVATIIMGMLYKIVPFLIWHKRFRTRTGRTGPAPTLASMYSAKLAEAGYWFWVTGVLVTGGTLLAGAIGLVAAPATLAQWTSLLTGAGGILFAWTLGEVIRA